MKNYGKSITFQSVILQAMQGNNNNLDFTHTRVCARHFAFSHAYMTKMYMNMLHTLHITLKHVITLLTHLHFPTWACDKNAYPCNFVTD